MSLFSKLLKKKETPPRSYADFWNWFRQHEKHFFNTVQTRQNIHAVFFDPMSAQLQHLKDGYFFLVGMSASGVADMIFTADGNLKNIVFVEELVAAAPSLSGWQFSALKPSLDIENVNIEMGGLQFNKDNLFFHAMQDPAYPDEIDITLVYTTWAEADRDTIINGAYIFLDNYLGELDFATTIDNLTITGPSGITQELIPVEMLKSYLTWRQKEFLEKYEGLRHDTNEDVYSLFEATIEDCYPLLATINETLLQWDEKASHPWMCNILFRYDGSAHNGLPGSEDYELLNTIEDEITALLKDNEGYLNIGRETGKDEKELFFACRDFREPSKVFYNIQNKYADRFSIKYALYKDKYWKHLERYHKSRTL